MCESKKENHPVQLETTVSRLVPFREPTCDCVVEPPGTDISYSSRVTDVFADYLYEQEGIFRKLLLG